MFKEEGQEGFLTPELINKAREINIQFDLVNVLQDPNVCIFNVLREASISKCNYTGPGFMAD